MKPLLHDGRDGRIFPRLSVVVAGVRAMLADVFYVTRYAHHDRPVPARYLGATPGRR